MSNSTDETNSRLGKHQKKSKKEKNKDEQKKNDKRKLQQKQLKGTNCKKSKKVEI